MIRAPHPHSLTVTTSYAHVAAVARRQGRKPVMREGYAYAVRFVPGLGGLVYCAAVPVERAA